MKNRLKILVCLSVLAYVPVGAITIAPSAEEVEMTFELGYRTLFKERRGLDAKKNALWHASHLDGLLQSPQFGGTFGLNQDLIEGIGGIKNPKILEARIFRKEGDNHLWISYRYSGTALVNRRAVAKWLGNKASGSTSLPMIVDTPAVYADDRLQEYADPKWKLCTDSHYKEPKEFSYFNNPFNDEEKAADVCKLLRTEPLAKRVPVALKRIDPGPKKETLFPLREIKGDNENGKLVVLYFIHGFDQAPASGSSPRTIHRDIGWKLYASLEKFLVQAQGFRKIDGAADLRKSLGEDAEKIEFSTPISLNHDTQRRYFDTFVKQDTDVTWVVRSGLFDTGNEETAEPLSTFPKFWQEAWKNGDVIYYNGHSGDGLSLSLRAMRNNLRKIDHERMVFDPRKTQISIFDGCSTYGYYQEMYAKKNPRKAHIVTFGVVSLYHLAEATTQTFLNTLLHSITAPKWTEAIAKAEQNQLRPQMQFYYESRDAERFYRENIEKKQYPNLLMNVWVP